MKRGFTLIELLLVIGILVILISATIIAINPVRQFAQANNASRFSNVTTLMNAVYQNIVDNAGQFDFAGCPATAMPTTATIIGSGSGQADLCGCLVPTYLSTIPADPQNGNYASCTSYDAGYTILQDSTTGRITITAPSAQLGETISLTR